ncbi:P-loop containing nucleoside triphosphate hydrolase protein [Apiospora arundinis]|uniref:P-loop containing nucleoside triphosphate hydrolase protein n=1 Tax=Apiospora arundinis TaxID=335852 RepID=A0ABR2IRD4_9PEZI
MAEISLDTDALDQLQKEQKPLLDTIDGLRKYGIKPLVDFPQIVVVGDQSSGKSSVLESISGIRFPFHEGLCTRFTTELVLRTDARTRIDVQIQRQGSQPFSLLGVTAFDQTTLPRLIKRASHQVLPDDGSKFSEDVVRVKITGPGLPSLTMVDLPGFNHTEDKDQSAAGRVIMDRLVERYTSKNNSIILAVISARIPLALQNVLSKLEVHDEGKERTLGVITKPDVLLPYSQDEEAYIRLAKNQDQVHQLPLGWHVLRNRTLFECGNSDDERDRNESEYFQSSQWSTVPKRNRGVSRLRDKLSKILLKHMKERLPRLIQRIELEIDNRYTEIKRLGEPRSTPKELRSHLDKIASQFHMLSSHAVDGNYTDEFFGGLYPTPDDSPLLWETRTKKLRALVRYMNRAFAHFLATRGSRRNILPRCMDILLSRVPEKGDDDDDDDYFDELIPGIPWFHNTLEFVYQVDKPEDVSFETIVVELQIDSANQGNEFPGTPNDQLAAKLFRDQCQPWERIAQRHIQLILEMSRRFVGLLLNYITTPDGRTRSAILTEKVDLFFEEKSLILKEKLRELLRHYHYGHPQPLDAEFRKLLKARCRKNPKEQVEVGIREFEVEGIVEKSQAYYEMALRTFTDNVIILAIENCLIQEIPLIFTTQMVNQMELDELERFAAEPCEVKEERAQLQKDHDDLKEGLNLSTTVVRLDDSRPEPRAAGIIRPPSTATMKSTTPDAPSKIPNKEKGQPDYASSPSIFGNLEEKSPPVLFDFALRGKTDFVVKTATQSAEQQSSSLFSQPSTSYLFSSAKPKSSTSSGLFHNVGQLNTSFIFPSDKPKSSTSSGLS